MDPEKNISGTDAEKNLELIARTIRESRREFEKNAGSPMIAWGTAVVVTAVAVWAALDLTADPRWNLLWFLIWPIGELLMFPVNRARRKQQHARNLLNESIGAVWLIFGGICTLTVLTAMSWKPMLESLPITPVVLLLLGFSTALTGMLTRSLPIVLGGLLTALVGTPVTCVLVEPGHLPLATACGSLISLVLPGLFLNRKTRKSA